MEQHAWRNLKLAFLILISWSVTKTIGSTFGTVNTFAPSLVEGLDQGLAQNKVVVFIFHKAYCSACQSLKVKVDASTEIKEQSVNFILVGIDSKEDPHDLKYEPDGSYTPRILFIAPNGTVLYDIINVGGNEDYRYFYYETNQILASMATALKVMQK